MRHFRRGPRLTRAHTRDRPGSQRQRARTDRRESGSPYKYQNNSIGHLLAHSLSQVRRALTHGHVRPSVPPRWAWSGRVRGSVTSVARRAGRSGAGQRGRGQRQAHASTEPDTDGTRARSSQGTCAQREAALRTGRPRSQPNSCPRTALSRRFSLLPKLYFPWNVPEPGLEPDKGIAATAQEAREGGGWPPLGSAAAGPSR